ncbi:PAS domain-containing protein [Hwanghaeella grinnelliae]|uniref:PAS domain-containing protein n=1 Tax=Hwanghaeella grinnelliae TaxID=2500179 RepID=UPI001386FFDB|nr:PAS domain-containing protein [Hwanghaeella grinnelliae]
MLTFFDSWRSCRKGALLPMKRDFDPSQISSLLRYAWLYRYEPQIGDFLCLLAGEDVNQAWGRSIRGKTLAEIVGEDEHPAILQRWREVLDVPLVQYGQRDEQLSNLSLWKAERLLMPLSTDGEQADHIIGVSLYSLATGNVPVRTSINEGKFRLRCDEV